jgi:hypothetical protein
MIGFLVVIAYNMWYEVGGLIPEPILSYKSKLLVINTVSA